MQRYDVLRLKCPLTLQVWFFAREVSNDSLQLAQLAVRGVNVCLTVCPVTQTNTEMERVGKQILHFDLVAVASWYREGNTHQSLAIVRSGAIKSWRP